MIYDDTFDKGHASNDGYTMTILFLLISSRLILLFLPPIP
jgi:hypothetical protein